MHDGRKSRGRVAVATITVTESIPPRPSGAIGSAPETDHGGETMRIESGRVETGRRGSRDPDWPHYDLNPRTSTVDVPFKRAFTDAPTVVVGLSKVEWEQPGHKMVAVHGEDATPEGFKLRIESGRNTKLERGAAFWVAYSATG
ncbi:MAG: H-type lectin domain-containing protein [Thermoanaerobaculia bacterium]